MAAGLTYESSNRFNLGVFVGLDRMFGNKRDWIYHNKAWIGFGFGYKFGGAPKEKSKEEE